MSGLYDDVSPIWIRGNTAGDKSQDYVVVRADAVCEADCRADFCTGEVIKRKRDEDNIILRHGMVSRQ